MMQLRRIAVILLLLTYCFLAIGGIWKKSVTFDEIQHLTAGYSYWAFHDYRLNPENGILPQRLSALPLLFSNVHFPSVQQPAWRSSNVLELGYQFFYESRNDADCLLLRGRLMIVLLGVGLGWIVYSWSRNLFGYAGGLISLALYTFCPTLLANGALVTSDMAAAFFLIAAVGLFWKVIQNPEWKILMLSAVAVAALFLSKFSGPAFIPVAFFLIVIRMLHKPALKIQSIFKILAVHAAVFFLLIWAFYGFRYESFVAPKSSVDQFFEGWNHLEPLRFDGLIQFAREKQLLPESYLYGFATVLKHGQSRRAFLNGQYSLRGWWYFFPYSFLVKTPLPSLVILILASVAAIKRWKFAKIDLYQISPLLILLAVYWILAIFSTLNIGHRHILPVYPAFFILAGATAWWVQRQYLYTKVVIGLLLIWVVAEAAFTYPNFLSYFNQFAGGPRNGYRHMADSSLDWGQDLPALKEWLNEHSDDSPVYLSYFGVARPQYYGINTNHLPSYIELRPPKKEPPLVAGIYCISATMLQSVYSLAAGHWSVPYETAYQRILKNPNDPRNLLLPHLKVARLCAYLRKRNPDDFAGYSILIFRLSDAQLQQALYGPPAELVSEIDIR